jgi:FkbM family methyltransferase
MHVQMRKFLTRFFRMIGKQSSYFLGKGYGSTSHKLEVESALSLLPTKAKLIMDMGANVGSYTEELLRLVPGAEIHLFEPIKENAKLLTEKFKSFPNLVINEVAISDKNGAAILYSDSIGSSLSSLKQRRLEHYEIDMSLETKVNAIIFEDYHRKILGSRVIDLVKIDIEGLELNALRGFGDAINSCRLIQFEFGGCNIDTRTFFQDFWYFFLHKGFKLHRISPLGLIPITHYLEEDEDFRTTNYLAINVKFN